MSLPSRLFWVSWAALCTALSPSADAAAPAWAFGARAPWVLEAPTPPAGRTPGSHPAILLHDRQIRITEQGDERYEHVIEHVGRDRSGEAATQFYVELDPVSQSLRMHRLRITDAHGAVREFTGNALSEVLSTQPAEAEPNKRLLDQHLLVSARLPDTQAADLLEYEYTVSSRAMLPGHYAAQWPLGADVRVGAERLRVTWPQGRPLRYQVNAGTAAAPAVLAHDNELAILQWDFAPQVPEPDLPRGYEERPSVELSDFADWQQVARLLTPWYASPAATSPADPPPPAMLLEIVNRTSSRVRATNVRGERLYRPADPSAVLARGFGDSHDLARLLAGELQQAGFDARVALGNGRAGAMLERRLPSPALLDTAMVRVRADHTEYWLNPAAPGPMQHLPTTDPMDLREVAVLEGAAGLIHLPAPAVDSRQRTVTRRFDLTGGNTQPALLTVLTRYQGSWAQSIRAQLAQQSEGERALAQIQSVASDYPAASAFGAVSVKDVPEGDALEIRAQFHLPQPLGDPAAPAFTVFAGALASAVEPREEATRRAPLGVPWPLQVNEHIEVALPPALLTAPGTVRIEHPAFRYQRDIRIDHGRLTVDHRYTALADQVSPADYAAFLQANAQVYQALSVKLERPGFTWPALPGWLGPIPAAALVGAATLGLLLWRRARRRN